MLVELKADERNSNGTSARYATIDAQRDTAESRKARPDFFYSNEHMDRIVSVIAILTEFFNRKGIDYENARAKGKRPYTVLKMTEVGGMLNRRRADKQVELLDKLAAIPGNEIAYMSKDGNFLVYIY